jgi:hypothetical protein
MSSSRPAVISPERTRQQLQELDALLQQMLALPLAEEATASGESSAVTDDEPIPAVAASPGVDAHPIADPLTRTLDAAALDEAKVKRRRPLPPALAEQTPGEATVIAARLPVPMPERPVESVFTPEETHARSEPAEADDLISSSAIPFVPVLRSETQLRKPNAEEHTSSLILDPFHFDRSRVEDLADPMSDDFGDTLGLSRNDGTVALGDAEPSDVWSNTAFPSDRAFRRSVSYETLVGVNRVLETFLGLLGPLGRPFLSDGGRNVLGWLGLILLIGSTALALGVWLGWTW